MGKVRYQTRPAASVATPKSKRPVRHRVGKIGEAVLTKCGGPFDKLRAGSSTAAAKDAAFGRDDASLVVRALMVAAVEDATSEVKVAVPTNAASGWNPASFVLGTELDGAVETRRSQRPVRPPIRVVAMAGRVLSRPSGSRVCS